MKPRGRPRKKGPMIPRTPFEKRLFKRFEEHARQEEERQEKIKSRPKPMW